MRGVWPHLIILAVFWGLSLVPNCAWSQSLSPTDPPKARARLADQFIEALRYEHGEGVPHDYALALKLYCEAADEGDTRPFFNLGWMYFNGRGVGRDDAVAAAWFRKAAAHGVKQATTLLQMLGAISTSERTGCPLPPPVMPVQIIAKALPLTPPADIRSIVEQIAGKYGLDVTLVYAVIAAESNFDALAESNRHAKGLMQLLPETAARFGVKDIFDPSDNIRGGMIYLRWLIKRFSGNLDLALAAYNAGEGSVDNFGGVPPYTETINYIARIKRYYPYQTESQASDRAIAASKLTP